MLICNQFGNAMRLIVVSIRGVQFGEENGVDHVDDAVAGLDVYIDNGRGAPVGVR